MSLTNAYGFMSSTSPCRPLSIERREPGPTDVFFDIAHAGICHSDIHTARGEWGPVTYPIVVGHEIAGVVREVGSQVTKFKPGDRVGVGCMVDSCGECGYCFDGREQFCEKTIWTYDSIDKFGNPTHGGYSQAITVDERFVFHIPDAIALDEAAPLLCAGITTYSPLKRWVAPGMKVAVVGLGGLGHVGVQIAAAMGADVSVISQTMSKSADGLAFGAQNYYAASEPGTFARLRSTFDMILCTVSTTEHFTGYIGALTPTGALINVGMPGDPVMIQVRSLLPQRTMQGSQIGGCAETQEMLNFCAEHGVRPRIEKIGADQIDEAWQNVINSKVRYRYVIDADTFGTRG
ncbi:MAG: NAD(P)-dependent alcohol dehydrogenase [Propionibacteriaceae bacterium]|nr:NAD(P)-dependent alcohol dehydrogenase [Propionibacteriaceae bacterium]